MVPRGRCRARAGTCPPLARCWGACPALGVVPAPGAQPGRAMSGLVLVPGACSLCRGCLPQKLPAPGHPQLAAAAQGGGERGAKLRSRCQAQEAAVGREGGAQLPTAPPSPQNSPRQQLGAAGGQPSPARQRLRLSIGFPSSMIKPGSQLLQGVTEGGRSHPLPGSAPWGDPSGGSRREDGEGTSTTAAARGFAVYWRWRGAGAARSGAGCTSRSGPCPAGS